MATGQQSEPFTEPPRDQIPGISALHVSAMESSDADEVWIAAGMNHVVLYTTGRRTGAKHKVALPFWRDAEGHRIVVASFAGARNHPAWYFNLADREANPEVLVRVQGAQYWTEPQILEGDDYQQTWNALATDRPFYNDYRTRTDRQIPLVRLAEQRPA